MENKRLSNKLNSWFWFILTALPIILLLIIFIFALPQYAKNFNWNTYEWYEFIDYSVNNNLIYENLMNEFDNMSITFIRETFDNVLENTFNVSNRDTISYLFGWMLSVQVYHLIYDVLKFIIEWCHNLIEKAY